MCILILLSSVFLKQMEPQLCNFTVGSSELVACRRVKRDSLKREDFGRMVMNINGVTIDDIYGGERTEDCTCDRRN